MRVAEPSLPPRPADSPAGEAPSSGRLPGDPGLWFFIVADMAMFGILFLIFVTARAEQSVAFDVSRRALDIRLGLINTLILLFSSWCMVQAVVGGRRGDRARTIRFLLLSALVGSGFAVTKIIEYSGKIAAGQTMLTNDFFMYYYVLTGIHFVHFLMGIAAILVMVAKARHDRLDQRFTVWIESVGCYWHMVDLLWIMLFPLLYLQRAT